MSHDPAAAVRGLGFVAGVLERQGHDPLCRECKSYALVVETAREAALKIEAEAGTLENSLAALMHDAMAIIASASMAADPKPQRKIGACKLRDGKCFVKYVRAFALPEETYTQKTMK